MTGPCRWIDPLTDPRWPRLLERHARASIFHSRGWLEALKRTYGYEPIALTTEAPNGELSSGAVFCRVNSWLTGRRLVSLPFSDHCDPLVRDRDDLNVLTEAIHDERHGWKYIELRPRHGLPGSVNGFKAVGRYYLHRLNLTSDPKEVLASFHKSHVVRKIRRSERENLVYEEGRSDRLLRSFYALQLKTRRRHRLPPQPETWFRTVLDCFPDEAKIRAAFHRGVPVASILTLRNRDEMIYKYGASDAAFHNLGGMQLLLWRTIQEACEQGCTVLDLGRSKIDSLGEVAFKDHWGATRSPLTYWRYPETRKDGYVEQLSTALARRVFSCLPGRLLIAAGRGLYRHMG